MPTPNKRLSSSRSPKKTAPRGNARLPKRERLQRVQARSALARNRAPLVIPVTWLNTVLGILLLPLTVVTTLTFFSSFADAAVDRGVWRTAPFWFFCWGLLIWVAVFAAGFRPRFLYVLGHELTHALFVIICGGRIHDLRVNERGGHVVTDKNNLLISLSPYFVPFWTLVVTALYGLAWMIWDLGPTHHGVWLGHGEFSWDWVLFFAIGYTWGLHLTFTVWAITQNQPDLRQNGTFFSLIFVYFINLVLISGLLVAASPELTLGHFADDWWLNLRRLMGALGSFLSSR